MDESLLIALSAIGALATALFTGYAIFQRWIDRPRPRWQFTRGPSMHRDFSGPHAVIFVTVTNVGDGTAYDVRCAPWGTTAPRASEDRSRASSLANGESVRISIHIPATPEWGSDRYGDNIDLPVQASDMGRAGVTLTWNHPPHRWSRRRKAVRAETFEA